MLTTFTVDGGELQVALTARRPELRLAANGHAVSVSECEAPAGAFVLQVDGQRVQGWRLVQGNDVYIRIGGRTMVLQRLDLYGASQAAGHAANEILSDMPGTVVTVHVAAGAEVREGDPLLTIESMKLQVTVTAPRDGRIAEVYVGENASFDRGVPLIAFAAAVVDGAGD